MADDDQDGVIAIQQWEAFYEVHRNRIPRSYGNREESKGTERLVMDGFASAASGAGPHIVGDESDQSGPVELASDVTNRFTNAWVPRKAMVVTGS